MSYLTFKRGFAPFLGGSQHILKNSHQVSSGKEDAVHLDGDFLLLSQ